MRTAIRFLRDPGFRVRVLGFLLGRPTPLVSPDRTVLETIIFPYFQCLAEIHSVLFVGCDWYTRHYERAFFTGKDYWTIDPAPAARKFAGRQHVLAPLEELGRHFPPERFDLIVCNGVFGYGLNEPDQCEQALRECYSRLRANGYFVMGWDDTFERTSVPMSAIRSLALFERFEFPPLGSWRHTTDTAYRHTYDFYRRTAHGV